MGNEREVKNQPQTLNLICKHCGNQLDPRKFEYDDEILYGIFDNCEPFDKQMLYSSLTEAILAFNGVPAGESIENLINKYIHG